MAYALILIVIVAATDMGSIGWIHRAIHAIPFADKICHFLLIGALAFVLEVSLSARVFVIARIPVRIGSAVVLASAIVEEISQAWIPTRHFDWGDLAANVVGIACGGAVGWYIVRRAETVTCATGDP